MTKEKEGQKGPDIQGLNTLLVAKSSQNQPKHEPVQRTASHLEPDSAVKAKKEVRGNQADRYKEMYNLDEEMEHEKERVRILPRLRNVHLSACVLGITRTRPSSQIAVATAGSGKG